MHRTVLAMFCAAQTEAVELFPSMGQVLVQHKLPLQYLYNPISCSQWTTQASTSSLVEEIDEQLQTRDELLTELKHHLETASNRMKQQADRKHRDVEFAVDEWVFLRLQPYRQKSVFKRS